MSMNELRELATTVYYGNELRAWLSAAVSFALWLTVLPLVRGVVLRRVRKQRPTQSAEAHELALALLGATTRLFLFVVAACRRHPRRQDRRKRRTFAGQPHSSAWPATSEPVSSWTEVMPEAARYAAIPALIFGHSKGS